MIWGLKKKRQGMRRLIRHFLQKRDKRIPLLKSNIMKCTSKIKEIRENKPEKKKRNRIW